jgi:hypothetical protein
MQETRQWKKAEKNNDWGEKRMFLFLRGGKGEQGRTLSFPCLVNHHNLWSALKQY